MNRRSKRINKKKAVPLYFQKSHSNSQFLITANYKHQIKLLKKTNKELASSLQDVRCRAADQERALAECNRENTQMMFVKMKIKDIVETVQKLVTDLGEVYDVIDGKSFDFLKNCSASHQEARLQIRKPSISTIEESASMSVIEQDLNKEENLCIENSNKPASINLPSVAPSFFDADSSRTEIYNVPLMLFSEQKLQNASNENQSAVTRSSKSLERAGSTPLDPDSSPSTPQPPVLPPNFQLSFEPRSFLDLSKLKPITSQAPTESQKSADFPKPQLITSPYAIKNTTKPTISKIPVKKSTTNNTDSPQLPVPSNHMNRRKTFVVEEKDEEPQKFLPPSDRRGTFVLKSSSDTAKSDIISDRRGTFVLNSLADDTKPEEIFDRRATYFIPTQAEEQPDSSPPKAVENLIPVQNAAPNQTILLCEDMELTEIIPLQNQPHQFIPPLPPWNEKPVTKEPGSSGLKLSASVRDQISCPTSVVKQFPTSDINSSRQTEISTTHSVVKDVDDQNAVSAKKNEDNKSIASFVVPKTELLTKVTTLKQNVNSTGSQQKRNDEKDINEKISNKKINIKCPAKELPSPITCPVKPDISIQEKIFHSISGVNTVSDKNKQTLDTRHIANDEKKSTAPEGSLSKTQLIVEKVMENEVVESPKIDRKSGRKQNMRYDKYFSDSEESDTDFDVDFIPDKRFSLKPGRKIINPNNNKVFVFKKNFTNDNETPNDKSPDVDAKIDEEKDVFNFSTSSDAGKSPIKKSKKRKSVMPKSNKRSLYKQCDVDKRLSKRTSKRNSKPEVNQDEVPVIALPRKSILYLNKDNCPSSLKSNRKSVRFTLVGSTTQDEINNPDCDSPNEINVTTDIKESNGTHNIEKESSGDSQGKILSSKKKYSSARSKSLKATGEIVKHSSSKSKKSRKRDSCYSNSDSLEDVCELDCSPKKKMYQESKESPPENIELCNNRGKQEQNNDLKDKFELSQGKTSTVSSDVSEEKPIKTKKEKNSAEICLELPTDPDRNVKVGGSSDEIEKIDTKNIKRPFSGVSERRSNKKQSMVDDIFSTETQEMKPVNAKKEKNSCRKPSELSLDIDVNKVKRPFSGVSERVSNKKQSIVDDLFPELDDAICEIADKKMETSFKISGLNKKCSIKEAGKSVDSNCNKGDLVTPKTSKQKSDCAKKKSSRKKKTCSRPSKDKENTPNIAENFLKLDVLTNDNNLPLGSKESVEKVVQLKKSKKKKETAILLQNDLKPDVLSSKNAIVPDEVANGRSRRCRSVVNFKEPRLNSKMRRE